MVSPDAGAIKRAKTFHSHFKAHGHNEVGFAVMHKERTVANKVDEVFLIGDVTGK